jgi:hypothetical protein
VPARLDSLTLNVKAKLALGVFCIADAQHLSPEVLGDDAEMLTPKRRPRKRNVGRTRAEPL